MSITNLVSEVECVLPKRYIGVLIPTIQNMIFFNLDLFKANQIKMRSLGWTSTIGILFKEEI